MIAQLDSAFIRARPGKALSRLLAYALFEGRPATTRGRWINPLVFLGHRLWRILPLPTDNDTPVFVLGQGRAGTTLLGKILGLHPELAFLNEPKALWQSALRDDDLIGSFSRVPGRYRMCADDASPEKIRRLRKSYAAYSLLAGCRRVVDKYPELIFRDGFLRRAFPGARMVVIIRDGRQAAASVARWSNRHGDPARNTDWWGVEDRKWQALVREIVLQETALCSLWPVADTLSRDEDRAAVEWIVTAREALLLKELHGSDLYLLPFEYLCADPVNAMREVLDFCGLPPDDVMLRYAERAVRPIPPHPMPELHPLVRRELDRALILMGYEPETVS